MIGVVVPVHNEADCLGTSLESIRKAAADPDLKGEEVVIIVVLDACTDASAQVARRFGAILAEVQARCVGACRAAGAMEALSLGARWIATTDADSEVPPHWLSRQLENRAEVFCGIVAVRDWSGHSLTTRKYYDAHYHARDDHRHIHGANLGICARAYEKAKGFQPLSRGEDVALVNALIGTGATIAWKANPCVVTSARLDFRAPDGFGTFLEKLKASYA